MPKNTTLRYHCINILMDNILKIKRNHKILNTHKDVEKDKFTHINEGNSKYFDHIQNYLSYSCKVGKLPQGNETYVNTSSGCIYL